jgi:small acid-soluble spore protein H (minor)
MNAGRAKEILESPIIMNVTYEGKPIIIQQVDEDSGTARIYFRENPEEEMTVPLTSLMEQ